MSEVEKTQHSTSIEKINSTQKNVKKREDHTAMSNESASFAFSQMVCKENSKGEKKYPHLAYYDDTKHIKKSHKNEDHMKDYIPTEEITHKTKSYLYPPDYVSYTMKENGPKNPQDFHRQKKQVDSKAFKSNFNNTVRYKYDLNKDANLDRRVKELYCTNPIQVMGPSQNNALNEFQKKKCQKRAEAYEGFLGSKGIKGTMNIQPHESLEGDKVLNFNGDILKQSIMDKRKNEYYYGHKRFKSYNSGKNSYGYI